MSINNRHLFASVILGVILVLISGFLYFSSAKFIVPPEIHLPSENISEKQKIEYTNQQITEDIVIDENNYKDIIQKLSRPLEYNMSVISEIHAFDEKKSQITTVTVTLDKTLVSRDNIVYLIRDNIVDIIRSDQIISFDQGEFSVDEIIGIPSYELILNFDNDVLVTKNIYNEEQALKIESVTDFQTEIYTVSLVTGMLMHYEVFQDNILVREVSISNLMIS